MEKDSLEISRRRMLQLAGGSMLALSASTAGCVEQRLEGAQDSFAIIKDPFFIVDKNGDKLGDDFRVDEPKLRGFSCVLA